MSWAYATPTELVAIFAEGAAFGAALLIVAKDAALRARRSGVRKRRAMRAVTEAASLRLENGAMKNELLRLRSSPSTSIAQLQSWGASGFSASNDPGCRKSTRRL